MMLYDGHWVFDVIVKDIWILTWWYKMLNCLCFKMTICLCFPCSYVEPSYSPPQAIPSSGRSTPQVGPGIESWPSISNGWTTGNTTERSSICSLGEDVSTLMLHQKRAFPPNAHHRHPIARESEVKWGVFYEFKLKVWSMFYLCDCRAGCYFLTVDLAIKNPTASSHIIVGRLICPEGCVSSLNKSNPNQTITHHSHMFWT